MKGYQKKLEMKCTCCKCLVKEKADFFDPIKEANLHIRLKGKKIWKAASVMKEDRQVFWVMLTGKGGVNLEVTF